MFIKGAAFFSGLAVLLGTGKLDIFKTKQPAPQAEPSGKGYRLTAHVKKYYETART
jgi:hypothetical protein